MLSKYPLKIRWFFIVLRCRMGLLRMGRLFFIEMYNLFAVNYLCDLASPFFYMAKNNLLSNSKRGGLNSQMQPHPNPSPKERALSLRDVNGKLFFL
jgi:hypothetical protein